MTPGHETDSPYTVPGLARGLRILTAFSRHEASLSAPELAKRLGIPRSTVFRLLATLEHMGFVERSANGRDYSLGLGVLRLGFECLASKEMIELGRPVLDRLRDSLGYSCSLVVRDGRSVVYVARAVAQSLFTHNVHLGTRLPAHATLFGRLLLRDLSFAQLRALYPEEQLHRATPSTPANAAELYRCMQADKQRGYLFEPGYFEASVTTLAAPVYGQGGAVVCALGITVPSTHLAKLDIPATGQAVQQAAQQLSLLLDHVLPARDVSTAIQKEAFA